MVEFKNKKTYFDLIKDFEYIPITQSEGWHDFQTCQKPNSTRFFADRIEQPTIALFGHVKTAMGLKMLHIEGECLLTDNIEHKKITEFYRSLQSIEVDIIEINSSHKYDPQFEIGIRRAGYLRPVGMFSIHLSSWIDLTKPVEYNNNWKRNIKLAENSSLSFNLINIIQPSDIVEFKELYEQHTTDKGISHRISEVQLSEIFRSKNFGYATVRKNEKLLSAIIFSKSKGHAGLIYAAKNDLAKSNGATFFMYDRLLKELQKSNFHTFDMERLLPSTHSTDGVFLFKQGIMGKQTIYNGEWSWYKFSILRPTMYFVKRFLFKRLEV